MQTGTIAKLIGDKNFGFIKRDGEEKDLFFHANELDGVDFASLAEGDTMSFDVEDGEKGPNAVKVSKA
jgi:cold shock protein